MSHYWIDCWALFEILPLLFLTAQGSKVVSLAVYEQEVTTAKYLYGQSELPELTAFTMCMWYDSVSANRAGEYIFNIANSHTDNELLIYTSGANTMKIHLNAASTYAMAEVNADEMDLVMQGWHQHCWSWGSGGSFKWYNKHNDPASFELYGEVDVGSQIIRSGGYLTIFQEQDSQLGSFDTSQLTEAKVAGFNMWDYELTVGQMNALTCETEGNLIATSQLQLGGTASYTYEDFDCGDNYKEPLRKSNFRNLQSAIMCKTVGAKLSDHILSSVTVFSPKSCVSKCSADFNCLSANYNTDNGNCDLNTIDGSDYTAIADFDNQAAANNLYFSSRVC